MVSIFVIGCSGGGDNSNGETDTKELTIYSSMLFDSEQEAFAGIIEDFEEENPDINIKVNFPGQEYTELLRVKMGSNDMPDLFDTHGWAISRYGDYTLDLKDMDWTENLDPELEPIITDDDGKLHTYPMNQAKDGVIFNENVLDEYDIEIPTTFDDFMDALYTIKEESDDEVVPLWIAGKDKAMFAQVFDQFASPLLTTGDDNFKEELLDGSFDWSNYTFLPEKLKKMQEDGLINEDALTADQTQTNQMFAEEKAAFTIVSGSLGPQVTEANPDVKLGIMPMPEIDEGDGPTWIGGERYTMSIWKDTELKEEAKKFIEYIAQPEIAKEITEETSFPAALTNIDADNYFEEYYNDIFAGVRLEPYFDRVYLPGGMWDTLGNTGQELMSGSRTPEEVSEKMSDEYDRLRDE